MNSVSVEASSSTTR